MGWGWYPKPKKRRPANGIVAKTQRGQSFGKTWWAGKWLAALERLVDQGRLSRGRSYARSGQVLNLDISAGRVDSRVQGSMSQPYKVAVNIKPLTDKDWDKVLDALAAQAIFAAKLLAGEMPPDLEDAFAAAGLSLFPTTRKDLETDCSCPDWSNPCKHIAAVYYLLGEQFDDDPFLLLRLRGRTRQQITAALSARRAVSLDAIRAESLAAGTPTGRRASKRAVKGAASRPAAEKFVPLAKSLADFWSAGDDLQALRFTIQAPAIEAAPIKRLGEPPFWTTQPAFLDTFAAAYAAVTHAALVETLGDGPEH